MYTISKEVITHTAHRLLHHKGDCNNVHGHTYRWIATVECGVLASDDKMALDFSELKKALKEQVMQMDHAVVLNNRDKLLPVLVEAGMKVVSTCGDPTAENFALSVYTKLESHPVFNDSVRLVSVTVYETPTSYATYRGSYTG